MGDVTPPLIQAPSSKERRYDRQLRLWAASGQTALEESHVLVINSGPGVVGVETLKNLVLPGIGRFTILDPSNVSSPDLGVNFFLQDEDLGKSRAERCCSLLQELNPDVQGFHITKSVDDFLKDLNALQPYTLILAVLPLDPGVLSTIAQQSWDSAIPVFYIHSLGFYSHFTLQLPELFPIVDTHPDPASTLDLRLFEPWPELLDFSILKTTDMEKMDDEEHGHIPYILLLLHSLQEWKSAHEGKVPSNYKEKSEFRETLRSRIRTNTPEGGEENFDEAVAAVLKTLNPATPSSAVKEVFAAEECQNLTKDSADFWIIAHAVHDFYKEHGVLPLQGGMPDMKAKSADYVQLQNIYKSKARQDVAQVVDRVESLEKGLGRSQPIDRKEIEAYCKCAGYVTMVRGRFPHLVQSDAPYEWKDRARFAANALQDSDSLILLYIAFLAYDKFVSKHGAKNLPEALESAHSSEITALGNSMIDRLLEEAKASLDEDEVSEIKDRLNENFQELIRARGGELHNISALTGGMIAQEAIKVITKQYIPVDNTCIVDGILSKTSVVKL